MGLVTALALAAAVFCASAAAAQDRGVVVTARDLETMKNENRVALVVGNGGYGTGPLRNPVNDARKMSAVLRRLGFQVIEKIDADYRGMHRAIIDFGRKLEGGGVGLFFYAGHAVQAGGRNFMIPVGAEIEAEEHIAVEAVSVGQVLARMGGARNRLNIVILDACRDNPFARSFRTASRGLAQMLAPSGTYIAYATAPGKTAADGDAANSPFTAALVDSLALPGLGIEDVFKRVRTAVWRRSGGKQVPWSSSSIMGDFYFRLPAAPAAPGGQTVSLPPRPAPSRPSPERIRQVQQWLSDLGYRPGPADGRMGRNTGAAIESFQRANGLNVDGAVTDVLLASLKVARTQVAVRPATPPPAVPTPAQPAVGVYPMRPGKTFKDCRDCPEMVVIPPGSFRMGALAGGGYDGEKPVRTVRIGYSIAVGRYEVTQAEWQAVMGSNPSYYKGSRNPVETVSWNDAKDFVRKLSARTGKSYRLLSEAEWEYVARAGSSTKYPWGNGISSSQAKFGGGDGTVPVGSYRPNAFGLYDTVGNVWEWTEDCWHGNYNGAPTNGSAWTSGSGKARIYRGGSWVDVPWNLRSAVRLRYGPGGSLSGLGFRLARMLP